jgi:hypothetical protein
MRDGNLLKEKVDSIIIRQLKAEIAALKEELAQQTNNNASLPCQFHTDGEGCCGCLGGRCGKVPCTITRLVEVR